VNQNQIYKHKQVILLDQHIGYIVQLIDTMDNKISDQKSTKRKINKKFNTIIKYSENKLKFLTSTKRCPFK